MRFLQVLAYAASAFVLVVCVGLIYIRQSPIMNGAPGQEWKWDDPFALYFMAKGVFCAVALILLYHIYAAMKGREA